MIKLFSLIYKDFLLLIRDKAGLVFLFVMPLVLVLVMTGMQEGAFENANKNSISVIFLDADNDEIGITVQKELKGKDIFDMSIADTTMTEAVIQRLVKEGDYLIGIYIPQNTTTKIHGNVQNNISAAFAGLSGSTNDTVSIKVFIDPTINSTFRSSLMSYLREACGKIENDFMLAKISEEVNELGILPDGKFNLSAVQPIGIEEISFSYEDNMPSSFDATLHNVPAWTLFAIFFIVISLSSNIIKELQDGSFSRLMTMPCTYADYLLSKVIVYNFVCLSQFLLILLMGKLLFPVIGLEAFDMHDKFIQCLTVVFCSSMAAIGFGLLISAFATTHQQAAIFGAVSVVLLSAIGGIWVPTFLMPKFLNSLSVVSPLNWGIEAFYGLVLRDGSLVSVMKQCIMLLAFATVCFLIAILAKKRKCYM